MKKKIVISKLFLYRYRFVIGYSVLGLIFGVMLFMMPSIAQTGLSPEEITSATDSYYLGSDGIAHGNVVDLPYRLLQKLSISIFGLSAYAIKLPSIIIGLMLGFLFILLLNRWFKSNVSLLTSCLVVLTTPFLFLAGSGTPLIMIVFWPILLLWLGSKIQGDKRPKPMYSILFAIIMLLSLFTPYMIYFAVFCVVFVAVQPHLRFVVKNLPKLPLILVGAFLLAGFVVLGVGIYNHPETVTQLLLAPDLSFGQYWSNIASGIAPVFSWHAVTENTFLSPLISLPLFALALIGLFSTTKGFFASRNSIATILLIFGLVITGFNPRAIVFLILPFSILIAHGLKYLLEKWYGLFPENPYARISALLPLTVLFGIIVFPGMLQYLYGYRYNPIIANEFSYDLEVIRNNLVDETLLVNHNYDYYKILENSTNITVSNEISGSRIAILGAPDATPEGYALERIITSPMRENSDIIYLYNIVENKGE